MDRKRVECTEWRLPKRPRLTTQNEGEKGFDLLEFPPEIRMMVINKMETKNKCLYAGTSKLCRKEAENSKNYIYGLELFVLEDYARIIVEFERRCGFVLQFKKHENYRTIKCDNMTGFELWETKFDNSENTFQCAVQHFKNLLRKYEKIIKELTINLCLETSQPKYVDFEIESLNKLQRLWIMKNFDARQFLEKTRRGLEMLLVERNGRLLGECEEIYQIEKVFHSPYTKLNNEQFLRLSAFHVTANIGRITEQDIYNFVRSWQNGTLGKEVERYELFLEGANFSVQNLFARFGEEHNGVDNKQLEIKHDKDPEKKALLEFKINSPPCRTRMITFMDINERTLALTQLESDHMILLPLVQDRQILFRHV